MSALKQLTAALRPRVGKGAARAARRAGTVPAVIYGGGQAPVAIALDYKTVHKLIYAGHFKTTIFEITIDGKKERAIPRDYQLDPVKDFPVHVDFLRLAEGATVRVEIPVHFKNQEASPGIKRGGVLEIVNHSILLVCPAEKIPEAIEYDLTGKEIGDVVHTADLTLPVGARAASSAKDLTIATIVSASSDSDEAASAEAPASA